MSEKKSLQEELAPKSICFGCGPSNERGLRIRSFAKGSELVAEFLPQPHHHAFPGVLNGGIIGTLLDCHCNWAAAHSLMTARGGALPCTVTADYAIALKRPCPVDKPLQLRAWVVQTEGDRCLVEGEITADGKVRATCKGTFVAVGEGHPAFHRW